MDAKMTVTNPDDVEIQLTVTMPLRQWRALRQQIGTGPMAYRFTGTIDDMIERAEAHFYPSKEAQHGQ